MFVVNKKTDYMLILLSIIAGTALFINLLNFGSHVMEPKKITRRIKLLSFNIHYGISPEKKLVLDKIVALIKAQDPDIIALQEVDRFWLRSLLVDQSSYLAKKSKMDYYYGPNLTIGFSQFGNCVLSKYPIRSKKNIKLTTDSEPRGLIAVEIEVEDKTLTILNTHLGLNKEERINQIQTQILPLLQAVSKPVLLAGDLNVKPESQEIRLLAAKAQDASLINAGDLDYTYPALKERIDYIFYSGLDRLVSYKIIPSELSDHYPLIIEFEI